VTNHLGVDGVLGDKGRGGGGRILPVEGAQSKTARVVTNHLGVDGVLGDKGRGGGGRILPVEGAQSKTARVVTNHLGVDGVLGHKERGGGGLILPVDRTLVWSGGRVLVRLLYGAGTKVAWFARNTLISKTWAVITESVKQGARVLLWPSGREVAVGSTLRELVEENHVTLELRWSGVGGGVEDDRALFSDHVGAVEAALGRGANVNCTCSILKDTPLHRASDNGNVEVARVLLAVGADLNYKDAREGSTSLHSAARMGRVEMARVLLAAGADINTRNRYGNTALHSAASNNRVEVVQVLLAAGADLNAVGLQGSTPLHWAANNGHPESVEVLLAAGADLNARNDFVSAHPSHCGCSYHTRHLHQTPTFGDLVWSRAVM